VPALKTGVEEVMRLRIAKRVTLIILSIWLVLLPISVSAGIWWDDFEDGRADGWTEVSGDWEVTDGTYQQTTMDAVYQKSILELEDLSDFTLEVDVTVLEGGQASTSVAAGVLVRTDAEGASGYRIWIRPDQSGFQFSVWQDNAYIHVIVDPATKAVVGEPGHLKVQIEGFTISAWVDDNIMVDEYTDADELFASGRVCLINYNAHAQYDNLIIEGPAVPTNLAVELVGKVAVAWGSIK
jgi:hypothetical protein